MMMQARGRMSGVLGGWINGHEKSWNMGGKAVHVGGLGDRCDGRTCGSAFLIASVVLAK